MTEKLRWIKGYRDVVHTKTRGDVVVDSCNNFDVGYETMVFQCDSLGNIESFLDLDRMIYDTEEEMEKGHYQMMGKWMCI